jgi:hypothetical protein
MVQTKAAKGSVESVPVQVRAGAHLMRGVIARKAMQTGAAPKHNARVAKSHFQYVAKTFPGSAEAERARRELRGMKERK